MTIEQATLPELFEAFLAASIDELDCSSGTTEYAGMPSEEVLINIRHRIAGRLAVASQKEIADGLDVLWRMMRHVVREECWWALQDQYIASDDIRPDIFEWLTNQFSHGQATAALLDQNSVAAPTQSQGQMKAWQQHKATVGAFSKQFLSGANSPAQHLHVAEQDEYGYWDTYWCAFRIGDWDDHVLYALMELAPEFQARIGNSPLFWATFGPVADATSRDGRGFENEIEEGWSWMLDTRIHDGRADLCDYWLAVERADNEDRNEAVAGLIAYIDRTNSAECEDFFRAFDQEYVQNPAAERDWPGVERLWAAILKKNDLSVQPWAAVDDTIGFLQSGTTARARPWRRVAWIRCFAFGMTCTRSLHSGLLLEQQPWSSVGCFLPIA
jgi:hypothetical protein